MWSVRFHSIFRGSSAYIFPIHIHIKEALSSMATNCLRAKLRQVLSELSRPILSMCNRNFSLRIVDKYDEMARRGDWLFQQPFFSTKVWLVLNNTVATAATCVPTFTPVIQAKVCRPEVAFLQDDLYALWLSVQRMIWGEYHGLRCAISKHSIPHHRLHSSRSKIHPLRYESMFSKCCVASRIV